MIGNREEPRAQIKVSLLSKDIETLTKIANSKGLSLSSYVRQIILTFLDKKA